MTDNPEDADRPIWTAEDFVRARPAADVLPPHLALNLARDLDVEGRLREEVRFFEGIIVDRCDETFKGKDTR